MRIGLGFLILFAAAGCVSVPIIGPTAPVSTIVVPLNPGDPERDRLGRLRYLGGVELRSSDRNFGGFSSLRWRGGRLHTVIDQGGWASFAPVERGGRLIGVAGFRTGPLRDEQGQPLSGWRRYDAEALAQDGAGWLVAFEHDHRIWRYATFDSAAAPSGREPAAVFGTLADNEGVETIAIRDGRTFMCAERLPAAEANCALIERGGAVTRIALAPPPDIDQRVGCRPDAGIGESIAIGVPTDADIGADGTIYVLFRSYCRTRGNGAGIVARFPDGRIETLAVLAAPHPVDNMEGIAVREEAGRTVLYLVSDDNFSRRERPDRPETWQRTLLLKFEFVR